MPNANEQAWLDARAARRGAYETYDQARHAAYIARLDPILNP